MEPEKKTNGALVGLVIIIIILVVGGIYIWMSNQTTPETTPQENVVENDTNELNSLETEIENTDTSTGVDANAVY